MAMRCGDNGPFLHEECFALGIAAITYDGVSEQDFSNVLEKDAKPLWKHLAPAQVSSLRNLCYGMKGGDTIFVKAGPEITAKGVVLGKVGARAYSFDHAGKPIIDRNGTPWMQQVPVAWRPDFVPVKIQVGTNQRFAIQQISLEDARRIEADLDKEIAKTTEAPDQGDPLQTESYLRASPAAMRIIKRRHNALSNDFRAWLLAAHGLKSEKEKQQIDVRFNRQGVEVLAELKVCYASSTRHGIRESLGQLLEYNYYPARKPTQEWLIILDCEPDSSDRKYIALLREKLGLPLYLGWQDDRAFAFAPSWP
jgi:hypothetical protein